jgi:protein SCO1/2
MKFIVITILMIFLNCKEGNHEHHHDHHNHKGLPSNQATEGSIYDLDILWKTHLDKDINLKEFKGETFLISMFYASCNSVCPRIVSDIKIISKKIKDKTGKEPKVVLISFDPTVDTPKVLKAYYDKMILNEKWFLLTAKNDDSVRMLSVLLGINYQRMPNGDYNHSTVISVISKEGTVLSRVEGIGANADSILTQF